MGESGTCRGRGHRGGGRLDGRVCTCRGRWAWAYEEAEAGGASEGLQSARDRGSMPTTTLLAITMY